MSWRVRVHRVIRRNADEQGVPTAISAAAPQRLATLRTIMIATADLA
jgi:hypothetical protein